MKVQKLILDAWKCKKWHYDIKVTLLLLLPRGHNVISQFIELEYLFIAPLIENLCHALNIVKIV